MGESNKEQIERSLPEYWADFLMDEFAKESDRAAVILTASLFENALGSLLKAYLVPNSNSKDELFDGPTAPLGEFSSKIQIAHRLGLISQKFASDLHLIKKIRNEFAHNVHGSNLETGRVKDLLTALVCSSDIVKSERKEGLGIYPKGSRGDFLVVANIMLFHLHQLIERISKSQVKEVQIEWIYSWSPVSLKKSNQKRKSKKQ